MALLGLCAPYLRPLDAAALLQRTVVVLDGEHLARPFAPLARLHRQVVGRPMFHVAVRGDRPKHLDEAEAF